MAQCGFWCVSRPLRSFRNAVIRYFVFHCIMYKGEYVFVGVFSNDYRFGKDVDVLSVQIGDINDRYYGCLYFHTNRADDAFETIHRCGNRFYCHVVIAQ